MPTISLNPDNLKVAIQDLRDLADDCETAASDIDTEFETEHDPMDPGTFTGDATAKVSAVRDRADDVESVGSGAVTVNGSASPIANGMIAEMGCPSPDTTRQRT